MIGCDMRGIVEDRGGVNGVRRRWTVEETGRVVAESHGDVARFQRLHDDAGRGGQLFAIGVERALRITDSLGVGRLHWASPSKLEIAMKKVAGLVFTSVRSLYKHRCLTAAKRSLALRSLF
jgi:hypothetical protein